MGKKKSNGYGLGTFIETKMFLSSAFVSLGQPKSCEFVATVSVQLLICFLGKRQFANAKDKKGNKKKVRVDENRFAFTYKELTGPPLNLTQPRATRGLDELLAKGFIERVDPGGAYDRHKALYALVDDWQYWKPGDPPLRRREKDVKRGFQGKGLGAVSKFQHAHTLHRDTHAHIAQEV